MYREAKSLRTLKAEVDKRAPHRSTASDGWIGDDAHASRDSDHNPWVTDLQGIGVVRARDFTNDLRATGLRGGRLAAHLAARLGNHPALSSGAYVIWNRRIISADRIREGWRPYTGANGHTKHVHVSVATGPAYDATAAYGWQANVVRLVTANMNLYRANDEAQIRYLDRLTGRGLILMQERLGIGRRSTVIRRVGMLTRNLPRWGIGRVGAHKYVARTWIRVNGVQVRVFNVHGLHRKTNGNAAADDLLRTLGRRVKALNAKGIATIVGGDLNTQIERAAELIGGTGHGVGIDGFIVSSHLEVTAKGTDRFGLETGLTDHPYYWIDVRAKRKAN